MTKTSARGTAATAADAASAPAVARSRPRPTAAPAAPAPTPVKARRSARAPGDAAKVDDIRDAVTRLKRERIIEVAVELFYSNGFSNTTLEAVGERMNVTKPFIYSYFRSKSELLAEICARGIRASLDAINRIVSQGGPPTDQARALAHDFMAAVLENQKHIAIYSREEKNLQPQDAEAIAGMRREFDHKLTALIEQGNRTGEFAVADPKMASLAIGGIASWSYVWFRANGRLSRDEVADHMAQLVMDMIQAKPAAPGRKTAKSSGKA